MQSSTSAGEILAPLSEAKGAHEISRVDEVRGKIVLRAA